MMGTLGRICLLLLPLLECSAQMLTHQLEQPDEFGIVRLPTKLIPSHYLVRLQPFINGNRTFNGYIEITFIAKEPTDRIIIHIYDIITKNDTVEVYSSGEKLNGTRIPIKKHEFNQENEFYIATLSQSLKEGGIYVLAMEFQGYLNDNLEGFYWSSYQDKNGKHVSLANTHFEPSSARRAFPCFDEPSFKAKFTMEMVREEGLMTISNMPRYETVPSPHHPGWFIDRFNTSLPMSSYLVAFIVSDFVHVELNDTMENQLGYNFRVWAKKESVSQLDYAMSLGPRVSKFFETYFDVPFPLPKQDIAAVPDLAAAAMENWGLIIHRENYLLYDNKKEIAIQKNSIAETIAHELAHQWFGNLVTPRWWEHIWLSEGFASYYQYFGLVEDEPSMIPMEQIVVNQLHKALILDTYESSRPLSNPNPIFSSIVYKKGGSIVRMMSSFLTEATFRKGLTKYLKDFSYSNAEQDDLFQYLTNQAHKDKTLEANMTVKDIMDNWANHIGYPILTVNINEDGTAVIQQEIFFDDDSRDNKWWIPLNFATEDEPNFNISQPTSWMNPMEATKTIAGMPSVDKWVIFNRAQTGYYRVNYDVNNWKQIIRQLKTDHSVISNINKAQLIDDSMQLAKFGRLSYDISLEIISYLNNETELVPITAASNNMRYIATMFMNTSGYETIIKFVTSLIITHYKDLISKDNLTYIEQHEMELIYYNWDSEIKFLPCIELNEEHSNISMLHYDDDTDEKVFLEIGSKSFITRKEKRKKQQFRALNSGYLGIKQEPPSFEDFEFIHDQDWIDKYYDVILKWLNEHGYGDNN